MKNKGFSDISKVKYLGGKKENDVIMGISFLQSDYCTFFKLLI